VTACGPWLLAELDVVRPTGVLVLGGTAGKALFGADFRVGGARGELRSWPSESTATQSSHHPDWVLTTTHPSAVLRSRARDEDYERLVDDLRVAAVALGR
jgi:DNA polymerase